MIHIKKWVSLVVPAALYAAIVVLLAVNPGSAHLVEQGPLPYLPPAVLVVVLLLGVLFSQSRAFFAALLLLAVTVVVDRAWFVANDYARGTTLTLLAVIYVPLLFALFYRLSERWVLTRYSVVCGLLVLSTVAVLLLVPRIAHFNHAVYRSEFELFRPVSPSVRIPPIGLALLVLVIPLLLIRKEHESPLMGPMFVATLIFVYSALNCHSTMWKPVAPRAVLFMFMGGAAFTLLTAVLEGSWRHANMDELTELPARRPLKRHLGRLGESYAIAVLDIDFFKKINDRYGHDTGDQVLRYVASCLRKNRAGQAYRYGGEEFVIIAEGDTLNETAAALEETRESVCGRKFTVRSKSRPRKKPDKPGSTRTDQISAAITVTVSIGVARRNKKYVSTQEVMDAADRAMYRAKKAGRNCLKISR